MIRRLVRLARPAHWIKNGFILLPIPFALGAGADLDIRSLILGIIGFSLINSAVYAFNDILDAEADRLHPRKRLRPVASGDVSARAAGILSAVLCVAGLAIMVATRHNGAIALAGLYLAINVAYTLGAKDRTLLDVFMISSGFVIRVWLGCVLIDVVPSNWLLLCSSALAIFLGFAKRRADLCEGLDATHRPSLGGYTIGFLDHAMTGAAGVALMSYALYSMDSEILLEGRELAGVPFAAYGVLFYLWQAHLKGAGGSPVEIALGSRTIWACVIGWGIAVTWSLGLW